MQTRLQVIRLEVVGVMKQTYEVFKHDGQEVFITFSFCTTWSFNMSFLVKPRFIKLWDSQQNNSEFVSISGAIPLATLHREN